MRKKFTMLLASLFLVMGVMKAQPVAYTVDATTGNGDKDDFFKTWTYTKSEANPSALTLTVEANNMKVDNNQLQLWVGQSGSSIYTLKVPSSYKIVSYSFDFVKVSDYSDAVKLIVGETEYIPTSQSQKLVVNDVNASSTSFKFTGANKGIVVTNFVVNIDYADCNVVGTRKSTFDIGDEMYIYSTCRVNGNGDDYTGFFTNKNNSASLIKEKPADLLTYGDDPIWVIASLETCQTEDEKSYYKVTLKNKATDAYLGIGGVTTNDTAGDNQTFYISQWYNAVFLVEGGQKAGADVWAEDEDGNALRQSDIQDTDPIWAVQAGNGNCFNTNGGVYVGNNVNAYPIVFYTVEDGKAVQIRVNMGEPVLTPNEIPVVAEGTPVIDEPIVVLDKEYKMTCVSMGNPHAVVFVEDTASFPVNEIGPYFENHEKFPNRTNTEFVQVLDRNHINMRVYERGTGETLACGTGCCATVVACVLNGLTDTDVEVEVLGGKIQIRWDRESNLVYMTGPATTVFEGEIQIE
jgi:hypothetical protein